MAEDSDLERTEAASSRRLEKAREEGNVPRSRELMAFVVLLAGVGGCWAFGEWLSGRSIDLLRAGLTFGRAAAFDPGYLSFGLYQQAFEALLTVAPLFVLIIAGTVAAPFLVGGWNLSTEALGFKFSRMNPIDGLKRLVSWQGAAELLKASLKALVVGGVIYWVVTRKQEELFAMLLMPIQDGLPFFAHMLLMSSMLIVGGVALIAAIDVPFQLWQYYAKLRMTTEELRQEYKETEGNPEAKGRQRQQQRESAKRRMMEEVPKADVVVTNPTHYAVALKYDSESMGAPRVVAKGMNLMAEKIRELATEHDIPILETPPLARALYRHVDEGESIPASLYTAVAEVMAYVYQLSAWLSGNQPGMLPPMVPTDINVPPELDPAHPAGRAAA